jgi:hypothetical protein
MGKNWHLEPEFGRKEQGLGSDYLGFNFCFAIYWLAV